jgi:hypothetical protein
MRSLRNQFAHTGFWPSSTEANKAKEEELRGKTNLKDAMKNLAGAKFHKGSQGRKGKTSTLGVSRRNHHHDANVVKNRK